MNITPKNASFFTNFIFAISFLFVLSSCNSERWNSPPHRPFPDQQTAIAHANKGDVITAIWLSRTLNSLGSSSFMFNYNHLRKRAALVNIDSYNTNVRELIYYHYVTLGQADSARVYLNKAFDYLISNKQERAAYTLPTYYMLMLVKQNQTKVALDACQYYLRSAKQSGSVANVGRCYGLLATLYKEIQMYPLAIPAYEKYVSIAKQSPHPDTSIYNDLNALAEINLFTGNYSKMNEALTLFDSLITKESYTDHLKGTISVWNALKASYLLKQNKMDSARIYLKNMREMYASTLISNHFNYETEIIYNENIGDYQQALAYSDTLLRLYKKNQEPRQIANAQLIRARINNKLGNYKESSQEYAGYILAKDSLNTVDLQKQVIAMQASKEVADAQLAEGIVKQRLAENQNITLWVFVIGLLIIGSLLAFLLTYYMKNQFRLKEYNAQLKVALSRAEEGVRVKENFMHHISHEIRTPLNSIIGFCSILDEMYPKDEQMHQYLRVINENGQKLVDVITGILNVSDLQNTMLDEPFTKEDISKLVADIIDKYRSRASVKTKISYQSSLPENFKLPIRLESLSMLLNGLISNAVKYTESGTITIINGLDDAKEYLVLSIEDTGIGINEDDADSIFDLFFKENKYELGGGTGLFVSQQVAEGHRGSLLYDKDYKEGARFVLKLPLEIA